MVKLINDKNVLKLADFVFSFFRVQALFTHVIEINPPKTTANLYAMWHSHQFAVWGIPDKAHLNVLISNSKDGEVVARAIEKLGFKVARGSSARKGCVTSTMQLISRIKDGESAAIMVDGPRGPLHKVKHGIITIAKETGAPIIPMFWYSPQRTFLKLPSWDKMTTPLFFCDLINLYGEPIYVNKEDDAKEVAQKIELALKDLEERAPEEYKKAKKLKLWKKRK